MRGVGDHGAWQYAVERFDIGDDLALRELAAWYLTAPASAATFFGPAPAEAIAAVAGKRKSDGRRKNARKGTPGNRQMAKEFALHLREQRDAELAFVDAEVIARGDVDALDVHREINAAYDAKLAEIAQRAGISSATLAEMMKAST